MSAAGCDPASAAGARRASSSDDGVGATTSPGSVAAADAGVAGASSKGSLATADARAAMTLDCCTSSSRAISRTSAVAENGGFVAANDWRTSGTALASPNGEDAGVISVGSFACGGCVDSRSATAARGSDHWPPHANGSCGIGETAAGSCEGGDSHAGSLAAGAAPIASTIATELSGAALSTTRPVGGSAPMGCAGRSPGVSWRLRPPRRRRRRPRSPVSPAPEGAAVRRGVPAA